MKIRWSVYLLFMTNSDGLLLIALDSAPYVRESHRATWSNWTASEHKNRKKPIFPTRSSRLPACRSSGENKILKCESHCKVQVGWRWEVLFCGIGISTCWAFITRSHLSPCCHSSLPSALESSLTLFSYKRHTRAIYKCISVELCLM